MFMKKGLATIAMTATVLSLAAGCGQSTPKPTYKKMKISQALKKIHFKVLQPTSFPFKVTNTEAEIETVSLQGTRQLQLFLIYQNKEEQKTLVEGVVNRHVKINSNGTDKNLTLANGDDAVYQNYSKLGVLYWWNKNQSYTLQDKFGTPTSNNTKPFLTPAQLVKIADSAQ